MPLLKKIDRPNSSLLVFTSAGDHSSIKYWVKGERKFDLWITYYGDGECNFSWTADYLNKRKGGKFPNLLYFFQNYREIFDQYDAFFVADDDVVITGTQIKELFDILIEQNLEILHPAFDPRGKISHPHTAFKPFSYLRYTNFVEMTCPLFKKDTLCHFLKNYDPVIVGYGTDWWFLHTTGVKKNNIAIVDTVYCRNPKDSDKGGVREISKLQSTDQRKANWDKIRIEKNIPCEVPLIFGEKLKKQTLNELLTSFKFGFFYLLQKFYRRILSML